MKIICLFSKNIKNLKAVEITPDGNIVTLTGKNAAGKSAILDSIFSALTGKRLKDPVRHGEERADVLVDVGEFTVRKRWTAKGEAIEVFTKNEEGKKVKFTSPQTFLDSVIGELSFDPLAFSKMDSSVQVELLKKIVGLDFTDLDQEAALIYNERTAINSRIREAIAHLKNTQAPDPETPDEEITFKNSLARLNDLRARQKAYQDAADRKCEFAEGIEHNEHAVTDIEEQIKRLTAEKDELIAQIKENKETLDKMKLPPVVSQDDIRDTEIELEQIEKKNADIRAAKRYRESIRNADKLKKESDALTQKLERIDQDKHTRAAAATMPIKGLQLREDGVCYANIEGAEPILFDRLSTGQQIRVSTAIGMALNPKFKVIFIREGSFLDSEGLKEVAAMAKDRDYQVWIERCDESGQVGFYIEDGQVIAKDGKVLQQGEQSEDQEED